MSKPFQLRFLISEDLEEYNFNEHHPDGLTFSDPSSDLIIEIRSRNEKGSYNDGYDNLTLRCTVSREVSPEHIEFVEALIEGRYLKDHGAIKSLPILLEGQELVDSTGKLLNGRIGVRGMLPLELLQLATEVDQYLREQATRFVQLLRWQLDAPGPTQILPEYKKLAIYWKAPNTGYHWIPMSDGGPIRTAAFYGSPGLKWNPKVQSNFEALWADRTAQEPLGHQLLREAKQIQDQNPRSALLIAYSALEVGTKQHISTIAPDAAWMTMNLPTPPLSRILQQYLPELHKGKPSIQNWSKVARELKRVGDFAEDRNRLGHRGEKIKGSLVDYLTLSENLLYALDVFEGREWAKSCVSDDFRKSLGWV